MDERLKQLKKRWDELTPEERKELSDAGKGFDEIEVGLEFEPYEYIVTSEKVEKYLEAIDDRHPWHTSDSPWGGPIDHPTRAMTDFGPVGAGQRKFGGIYAKQEIIYHHPIPVGKKITVRGRVAVKEIRRGRQYLTTAYEHLDENGTVLMESKQSAVSFQQVQEGGKQ